MIELVELDKGLGLSVRLTGQRGLRLTRLPKPKTAIFPPHLSFGSSRFFFKPRASHTRVSLPDHPYRICGDRLGDSGQ